MLLLEKDFRSSKGKAGEELVAAERTGMLPARDAADVAAWGETVNWREEWTMHEGEKAVGIAGADG